MAETLLRETQQCQSYDHAQMQKMIATQMLGSALSAP
jgi:hypothetical protein